MPLDLVERLVRMDLKKEFALKRSYGVEITDALVEAEVARINTTTRAPEILAEIKAALGNDAARFARSMARPIVVERKLRARFENDDKLHAAQRRDAEQARADLLAKKTVEGMHNVTWQLGARPNAEGPETRNQKPETLSPLQTKAVAKSGSYSIEATAQIAQQFAPPVNSEHDRKFYFEDIDPELQKVLRAQLRRAGDVSAVVETPTAYLLFILKEKTADALTAALLSIPKRSYEEWLAEQPD
jgi:hypothetical protein